MMKRNHSYEINHLNNTVTISRTFLEKASQISSEDSAFTGVFRRWVLPSAFRPEGREKRMKTCFAAFNPAKKRRLLFPLRKWLLISLFWTTLKQ